MSVGIWQIVLILAIVLIIFGAGKLPRVMGDVAKGVRAFKSGMKEGQTTEETKQITQSASAEAPSAAKKDEAVKS
jgi:sec-independent protein translocase protein TatA